MALSAIQALGSAISSSSYPLITPPVRVDHALLKRDIDTCGWVSGNAASPLTCTNGYSCSVLGNQFLTQSFACCNDVQCPENWAACQGYGGPDPCDGLAPATCSSIYSGPILSCLSAAPNCVSYLLFQSIGATATLTSFGCAVGTAAVLALESITNVEAGTTGQAAQPSATGSVAIPTDGSTSGSSTEPSEGTPNIGTTTNTESTKHTLSTGIIALIAVVAVGVIIAIVVGIFLCVRCFRAKKRRAQYVAHPTRPTYQIPDEGTVTSDENAQDQIDQWMEMQERDRRPYGYAQPPNGPPPGWR